LIGKKTAHLDLLLDGVVDVIAKGLSLENFLFFCLLTNRFFCIRRLN